KLLQRHTALRLQADIDQYRIILNSDDPTFDDGAFKTACDTQRFIKKRSKTFLRRRLPGLYFCSHSFSSIPGQAATSPRRDRYGARGRLLGRSRVYPALRAKGRQGFNAEQLARAR